MSIRVAPSRGILITWIIATLLHSLGSMWWLVPISISHLVCIITAYWDGTWAEKVPGPSDRRRRLLWGALARVYPVHYVMLGLLYTGLLPPHPVVMSIIANAAPHSFHFHGAPGWIVHVIFVVLFHAVYGICLGLTNGWNWLSWEWLQISAEYFGNLAAHAIMNLG